MRGWIMRGGAGEFTQRDRGKSLRLLATVPVGRLIFTVNSLPLVRPMNFALEDGLIVLRTAASTTAARKVDGMIVAFEADRAVWVDDLEVIHTGPGAVIVLFHLRVRQSLSYACLRPTLLDAEWPHGSMMLLVRYRSVTTRGQGGPVATVIFCLEDAAQVSEAVVYLRR
jgi:hypothetical protein